MLYQPIARFARMLLRGFGKFEIIGAEKLPKEGGYVITCTHRGWMDVVALGTSILPAEVHFMAKKELFSKKIADKFLRDINAFPVDRENPGPSSLKVPIQLLKQGKTIGIFPSGTRTSEDVPLKRGAVTIANLAKVPIVPAAYSGPKGLKDLLRGEKTRIVIGDPIPTAGGEPSQGKKDLGELTDRLALAMSNLEAGVASLD
ncbi:lysophospholipid acyltransferase family protein [Saccharibacillus sp. CPCC 101409]|uniref:lysophospholipid acyltransferase family protein n=1 Tax=Saccharibacillus sp. CPCC 101409 TaxID=3058041 RepID=UPI0026714F9B|nr:lysophospholipid acyltransferase family protein [Saccharibacillus sp. CPCC 101409]MDO3413344.1 lysophospholipid acyltransferase family protein [Saccharibacillus sp. CPCC 101409]